MKTYPGCLILASLLSLGSFAAQGQNPPLASDARAWVDSTFASMTIEEKIGQMIVPTLSAVFTNVESDTFQEVERNIKELHVGGYHAFSGDPAALGMLVDRMQGLAKIPLMLTADLEGGPGYQFANATRIPRAMALGATGSEDLAFQAGQITAQEGRAMGISVNFYPVVDVNNNPRNPIINIRSFGEDPALVSRMARAYIRGVQENGQIATAKHFPGHGDTSRDTHLELAVIDVPLERLNQVELPPFQAAIESGVGAVMSAHIYVPEFEPERGMPATLSHRILTDLLRTRLGFQGLVFTDAMNMQGVTAHFTPEDATLRTVKAGADIILAPVDAQRSFNAILGAVRSGDIPLARIEASTQRILEAKARLGLHKNRLVDMTSLDVNVGSAGHRGLARAMMEKALTLVRDNKRVLPLRIPPPQHILNLTILDSGSGWREGLPGQTFRQELANRFSAVTSVQIDDRTPKDAIEILESLADASDVVIAGAFIRVAAYKGSVELSQEQLDLLHYLSTLDKPFVFTVFGSPYLLSFVPELPTYILTYEYYPEAERAALRAMVGETAFSGKAADQSPGELPDRSRARYRGDTRPGEPSMRIHPHLWPAGS